MNKALFFWVIFMMSSSIIYSQEKLEIEGAIIIGNSEEGTPVPGTIRWSGLNFEGWNGFIWVPLTSFQITRIITDIDGNEYRTVTIGSQEWMAENLRTTTYRNGDDIPNVPNNTDWGNLGSGGYCWYNNDNSYETPYGKLYNWYAVNDGRGLCPTGWHGPTDAEWTTLTNYLGGLSMAGGPMKEAGTNHWNSPNTGANNESRFTGLPGGFRQVNGFFVDLGYSGRWWSSTSLVADAWFRYLYYNENHVFFILDDKRFGFSVRCLRD